MRKVACWSLGACLRGTKSLRLQFGLRGAGHCLEPMEGPGPGGRGLWLRPSPGSRTLCPRERGREDAHWEWERNGAAFWGDREEGPSPCALPLSGQH